MDIVTSLDNTQVKLARSLNQKKYRLRYGMFLVEGKKQVAEAISAKLNIAQIFVEAELVDKFSDIIAVGDAPIVICSKKVIESISDSITPQGIVAMCNLPPATEYKYSVGDKILILDRISDPGNMGTILRTAAALNISHIFAIDCADAFSPKVVRSSASGVFYTNIYTYSMPEVIDIIKQNNIFTIVADMQGESIYDISAIGPSYALVIGNEGNGVSAELKTIGKLVKLPMAKKMESLNAGVCASIILYTLEGKFI